MEIDAAKGSLYEGQKFELKFKFNDRYPFDSPSVTFIGRNIPEHSHVYRFAAPCGTNFVTFIDQFSLQ